MDAGSEMHDRVATRQSIAPVGSDMDAADLHFVANSRAPVHRLHHLPAGLRQCRNQRLSHKPAGAGNQRPHALNSSRNFNGYFDSSIRALLRISFSRQARNTS